MLKKFISLIMSVAIMLSMGIPVSATDGDDTITQYTSDSEYSSNKVIVKFKGQYVSMSSIPGIQVIDTAVLNPSIGQDANSLSDKGDIVSLTFNSSNQTVEEVLSILNESDAVEYAEPDFIVSANAQTPNDPIYSMLYGMNKINAPTAWGISTGSDDIVIGIIDTGIDYTHPDLAANIWTNPNPGQSNYGNDVHGANFIDDTGNAMDDNGHGTHVAGIIGAVGNNGIGVVGVNWNVKFAALKFLDSNGNGLTSNAIKAINYANEMGFQLTNNSWGGGSYSQSLKEVIADSLGLFIAAAGNNYGRNNDISPSYPASYDLDNIISVASTDKNDNLSAFSNIGPSSVDIAAPGSDILSTFPSGVIRWDDCDEYYAQLPGGYTIPNGYQAYKYFFAGRQQPNKYWIILVDTNNCTYCFLSGTSMATPQVSGVAALMLSIDPELSPSRLKKYILDYVDVIPALDGVVNSEGRLNAFKVAKAVYNGKGASVPYFIMATAGPNGTVTGSGIYNGCDGTCEVSCAETVTLVATPDEGYIFDGWYEDDVKINGANATYSFIAEKDRTLEARFREIPTLPFFILGEAGTGGDTTGSGVYLYGELVTLVAIPDEGYVFDGWYEDNVKITDIGATYTFIAENDRLLEARFIQE